jgi:hypothetical protein
MALDSAGMLAGMQLAGLISNSSAGAWAIIANHTFMVIGMIAGMTAAMALRRTRSYSVSLSRPIRRERSASLSCSIHTE